ncbi:MAG: hypothetical protein M3083_21180, partial [Actinomycetota bacterium]|nr:hypothetical protein [Actinomycetota bacterium]
MGYRTEGGESSGHNGRHRRAGPVRRAIQGFVALVVAVVPFIVTMPSALANVGLLPIPQFPSLVTVGQTGIPASIDLENHSSSPEDTGTVTIGKLILVPSCGTSSPVSFPGGIGPGDCPAAFADPGVFQLSATGTGELGTECAGQTFNISLLNPATGQYQFTPVGPPVVLTQPGTPNSICRIAFTFSVLKAPTKPASMPAPNTLRTDEFGYAEGTSSVTMQTGFGFAPGFVDVAKAVTTSFTTSATATGPVGSPITDAATLAASNPPGPPPT